MKNSKCFCLSVALIWVFLVSLQGTVGDKVWTIESLLELKTIADPQITADGTQVAYLVRSVNNERNAYDQTIWVVAATGGKPVRLRAPHFSDSRPRWSKDGRRLAFLSSRDGNTQVYMANLTEGPPRRISNSPTGITYFKWSPNNQEIGYLAADALTHEEKARIHQGDDPIVANEGNKFNRLYIVSTQGGDKARLVTTVDRHLLSFDWAPDRSKLVYAGQVTSRNRDAFNVDLYEIDLKTGRETPLVKQEGRDAEPCYSRDGNLIAFHSQAGVSNYFEERHVGVVPSGGGKIRYVTETFEGDVFRGGNEFWWSQDSSELVFGAGRGTQDHLYKMRLKGGSSERLISQLAGPSSFSISRNGDRIAFLKSSSSKPPDLYLAARGESSLRELPLSNVNPTASAYPAMITTTIRWKSKDGLAVEGVLRLPPNRRQGARLPLLVELHGGPTGVALEDFPNPRTYPAQLFVQAGFAVLAPNFRGSSNYGGKFRLANIKSQGFGDMDDVMTGIDTLIEQGVADPARLGVMGWSYGGFLTIWIISHSDRFKATSIGAPTTDWVSWYGASDGPRESMWTYFGGKPWDNLETYNRHSPRYHIVKARSPSLLLHGKEDIDSTPEIFQALTDLGVPVEFVTYPREGHGIIEPRHQRDLMNRNLQWFKRWVLEGQAVQSKE
jgi:dipeptidyl aminopeptidase/acylaminoacyl peptidase